MIKNIKDMQDKLILTADFFNLEQTFECGQCFRWEKQDSHSYIGIVKNQVVELIQQKDRIDIYNLDKEDFMNKWVDYFDLGSNYSSMIEKISGEKIIDQAIEHGNGIRILNQEEWETLISFILSTNNNIPRIKKIIDSLCRDFGDKIYYKGKKYYTFPSPENLKDVKLEDLKNIKCGYRANYIIDAVEKVNKGVVNLFELKNLSTEDARNELLKIKGVGPKVADCILLFSMQKYDCYPVDVWIKKVTEQLYFKREANKNEILEFAQKNWGEYAGFAQQYLFYFARSNLNK
ncbi:MAG: DNA-3-methyladenine glycosylase family protein [Eubacteriaceae bacterium]